MKNVVECLQENSILANAAILYYGFESKEAVFGHYVSIWHYDGENDPNAANWCNYDSFDNEVYFAETLWSLDEKLIEAKKTVLDNDNKFIHAFALPKFGPGRQDAIQKAINNVKIKVEECLAFYKLQPLIDFARKVTGTAARQGNNKQNKHCVMHIQFVTINVTTY